MALVWLMGVRGPYAGLVRLVPVLWYYVLCGFVGLFEDNSVLTRNASSIYRSASLSRKNFPSWDH